MAKAARVVVAQAPADAIEDGDHILAVISRLRRESGRPQPRPHRSQRRRAGSRHPRGAREGRTCSPHEIDYIEAHGTGTALGDPIEAHALSKVFGAESRPRRSPVGSVKTNLGHLESAAGVAGLIKVILSLQHGEIPRHLHFQKMNPHIDWGSLQVEIPAQAKKWEASERKRIAGVSSFGFSGTNAHVIVEEAPARERIANDNDRPLHILTLSARDEKALGELRDKYVAARWPPQTSPSPTFASPPTPAAPPSITASLSWGHGRRNSPKAGREARRPPNRGSR